MTRASAAPSNVPVSPPGHARWLGPLAVARRTRPARRAGDPGAALVALSHNASHAVGLRMRGHRIVLLLDPDLVAELLVAHSSDTTKGPGVQLTRDLLGDGLLTAEGEQHQRVRRLVAPAFASRRLAGYVHTFAALTKTATEEWQAGEEVDINRAIATLTLDIVGATLLGVDLSADSGEIRSALESALGGFGGAASVSARLPGMRRRRRRRPVETASSQLARLVEGIIASRDAARSSDKGDVISALLASSDAGRLSAAEVRDNVITLMMAGHETTANALTWTLWLLGQHPEIQSRAQAEVEDLFAGGVEQITFESLALLPYTRAVLTEAMRLYPPAWILGRNLRCDLTIAGLNIPAGSVVAVSPLLSHRDERWFADPERFDPLRWLDERRAGVPRHAYLPFGAGPRTCVGEQFAWAEAITVLATILSKWTVRLVSSYELRRQYRVTSRPDGPVPLQVTPRRESRS